MSESTNFWELVVNSFEKVITNNWHPPLYLLILYFFKIIFSGSFFGGYAIGILSVLISMWLIYKIVSFHENNISKNPFVLWLLFLSYYSLPLIIHGAFIFDIDNTILTPLLLFSYLIYLKFEFKFSFINTMLFIF